MHFPFFPLKKNVVLWAGKYYTSAKPYWFYFFENRVLHSKDFSFFSILIEFRMIKVFIWKNVILIIIYYDEDLYFYLRCSV